MTTKAEKEKNEKLYEIRLSLITKELVTDKEGKTVTDADGKALETHTQHTSFEITDQSLCKAINDLLADAITKEHMEDVSKHAETKEPLLDAHKFELTGKKPEKKKPAA